MEPTSSGTRLLKGYSFVTLSAKSTSRCASHLRRAALSTLLVTRESSSERASWANRVLHNSRETKTNAHGDSNGNESVAKEQRATFQVEATLGNRTAKTSADSKRYILARAARSANHSGCVELGVSGT